LRAFLSGTRLAREERRGVHAWHAMRWGLSDALSIVETGASEPIDIECRFYRGFVERRLSWVDWNGSAK
jgi:hypothetical protein